jgi:integration host factor subunit alpha|tara:strand:- start:93 stop:386 length:294 start_codon:yes stop_codon:yes gene_type:complete
MLRKNIKRKDLIANVYFNIGFSKTISENIVYDIFNLFINNIISNNVLKISNFGNFIKKNKKQRIGRNPKTKEVKVISSRNIIIFKASNLLKKRINQY